MPLMLDLALRWCKAKERWIDYVYDNIIKKYPKEKRLIVVKQVLGIKQRWKRQEIFDHIKYSELKPITREQVDEIPKSELYMSFKDTFDWSKLQIEDHDMYEYWKEVADWVDWFSTSHIPIESLYQECCRWRMSKEETIGVIMSRYSIDRKLTEFLIKSFK